MPHPVFEATREAVTVLPATPMVNSSSKLSCPSQLSLVTNGGHTMSEKAVSEAFELISEVPIVTVKGTEPQVKQFFRITVESPDSKNWPKLV